MSYKSANLLTPKGREVWKKIQEVYGHGTYPNAKVIGPLARREHGMIGGGVRVLDDHGIPLMPETKLEVHIDKGGARTPKLTVQRGYPYLGDDAGDMRRDWTSDTMSLDNLRNMFRLPNVGDSILTPGVRGSGAMSSGLMRSLSNEAHRGVLGDAWFNTALKGKGPRSLRVEAAVMLQASLKEAKATPFEMESARKHFGDLVQAHPAASRRVG